MLPLVDEKALVAGVKITNLESSYHQHFPTTL